MERLEFDKLKQVPELKYIDVKDIDYTTGKRVSFKRAFDENRAKRVF